MNMLTLRQASSTLAITLLTITGVSAQNYPSKPIRIVTTGTGGNSDFSARLIAQTISGPLGKQVVIENRGSGVIPGEIVSKAAPDGYTLLFYGTPLWLGPFMQSNIPYDPIKDFVPITWASTSPMLLVVHPSLPVKSVPELIALARAKSGQLNYASADIGSSIHLAAELFKSMARVSIVRINYKASGLAITDVMSGQVQLMFAPPSQAWSHVKSSRLRALAVTSAQPTALAPGLPTVAASGLAGYEFVGMTGVFAPANTSAAIITRLNQEMVRALHAPEIKTAFLNSGVEAVGSSPEQFEEAIKSNMARMGKVIKEAGIRAE